MFKGPAVQSLVPPGIALAVKLIESCQWEEEQENLEQHRPHSKLAAYGS